MTTGTANDIDALRERSSAALAERLHEHVGRLGWDAARIAEHQRDRLRALLSHAIERSPFHARRLAGIDPQSFELSDLSQLPAMTKDDMMASFDELVTDRRLSLRDVENHLAASSSEPSLLLDEYVCLASGGSSGLRGVFVQSLDEYLDFGASIMRPGMARAIAAGGPPPDGLVIGLVAAGSPIHSTGFAAAVLRSAPVQLRAVPATLALHEIVEHLNAIQPPTLISYASALGLLAHEQRAGRLQIAPRAISSTSETLMPADRDSISAAFGVPVANQFAATEGLVGQSEPGDSVMSFATDMCIVELVDADRVLVTNLHNFTQPLIRYELTDRFLRHPDAPDHGYLRASVDGRADEVFHYSDVQLHPHAVRTVMVGAASVREYQVRQTQHGVEVAVVVEGDLDYDPLCTALERGLADAGLDEPKVHVREVDAIARHPDTGKVRRFIPLA
jgi:phenylacetate-CoA ligase